MYRKLARGCTALLVLASVKVSAAPPSELQTYVQQCQTQLGFNAGDLPDMNCNDGPRFSFGVPPLNDFVAHRRVNDSVDFLVACRWGDDTGSTIPPGQTAPPPFKNQRFASVEALIHNRLNQQTCFFSAKDRPEITGDPKKPVPSAFPSPTNFGTHPNADDYWLQPTDLNNKVLRSNRGSSNGSPVTIDYARCVGCHAQGAIIASHDIVEQLARFGVINNRHETLVNMSATQHYHAVGASGYQGKPVIPAFQDWDNIIAANGGPTCDGACHTVATGSTVGSLFTFFDTTNTRILPSIGFDISFLDGTGEMPAFNADSNWHWINLDTPANGVETENFVDAKDPALAPPLPTLLSKCDAPANLEAHAVGVPIEDSFSTDQMKLIPDRLKSFNLKDGLVCLNGDQEVGQKCHDYQVRYLCDANTGLWSNWYNTDQNMSDDGDHEERSRHTGLCATPVAIQAHVFNGASSTDVFGPGDRLARLSPYALTCNNADQPNGQCSNYVVRYNPCGNAALGYQGHVASAWSNNQLTSTGPADNAAVKVQPNNPQWNTQLWELKPVPNTEYYWLRNTANNKYLNVSTQAESSPVVTYTLNTGWDSEKWILEKPLNGGANGLRLKNVWSGRYLTAGDSGTFAALYSQALNMTWASQLWKIN